jgi:hypothetical protein
MKYYSNVPYQHASPNKLDEAVKKMLKEFDDYIFEVKELPVIKSSINNIIAQLNKEHPRCKPIEPNWQSNNMHQEKKGDWSLFLSTNQYTCALSLILCREEKDL